MSALLRQMMAPSPAGLWPLQETSGGTAYDVSGFARNGGINGGIGLGAAGPAGLLAMTFDGANDYVSLPSVAAFATANSWTIMTWCYIATGVTGGRTPMGQFATGTAAWSLYHDTTGNSARHEVLTAAGFTVKDAVVTPIPRDRWYLCGGTWDGTNARLWIDGVNVATNTGGPGGTAGSGAGTTNLGQYGNAALWWQGRLAFAAIYPTVLGADVHRSIYLAGQRMGVAIG